MIQLTSHHFLLCLSLLIPQVSWGQETAAAEETAQQERTPGWRRVPPNVTAHLDLVYAKADNKPLLLDVFVPDAGDTKASERPLIVWVHGGAWQAGSKNNCPALRMTRQGYVVASISYRLSQDAIYPAQIEDCKAAIRWLRANASKFKFDPERIGVWGSSAGGHLVALLGTTGDVKKYEKQHGNKDQSSRVQAVCDFFGPVDFLRMDQDAIPGGPITHDSEKSPESKLIGGAIQENKGKVAQANPMTYITKDDPPFLIVHGDKDPLVPWQQSKYLHAELKSAGVSADLHLIPDAGHGFGNNAKVRKLVDDFFRQKLKPNDSKK